MENFSNEQLEREDILFQFEDDYASESEIYFEISSEDFQNETNILLEAQQNKKSLNIFFWEENDEFGIYD